MVAAQDHRQPALAERVIDAVAQHLGPADGFGQGMHRRVRAGHRAQGGQGQVAPILDPVPLGSDFARQARHAIGRRAHQAAGSPLTGVDRCADQDGLGHGGLRRLPWV